MLASRSAYCLGLTSVHNQRGAIDPSDPWRDQPHGRIGNLLRRAEPPGRHALADHKGIAQPGQVDRPALGAGLGRGSQAVGPEIVDQRHAKQPVNRPRVKKPAWARKTTMICGCPGPCQPGPCQTSVSELTTVRPCSCARAARKQSGTRSDQDLPPKSSRKRSIWCMH